MANIAELKSLRADFRQKLDNFDSRLTENRGRRKNLRLINIQEGVESQQTLSDFDNGVLTRRLGLAPERSFTLERVHRTLVGEAEPKHSDSHPLLKVSEGVCLS